MHVPPIIIRQNTENGLAIVIVTGMQDPIRFQYYDVLNQQLIDESYTTEHEALERFIKFTSI